MALYNLEMTEEIINAVYGLPWLPSLSTRVSLSWMSLKSTVTVESFFGSPDRIYPMLFGPYDVKFRVEDRTVRILSFEEPRPDISG